MKRNTMKTTALALSAAIVLGVGATAAYAQKPDTDHKSEGKKPQTTVSSKKADTPSKDETVYILSGADGAARQVIVSNWLSNPDKDETIEDVANLKDIENVKGNETFTTGKNGELTWNAAGSDIYYQGTPDQKVPVEVKITYTLDGKEIAPQDLAGKSGKVTIRFDYSNHQFENVKIGGKQEKICVPFVMLTGVMLDTDLFRNVTVTNGKLENLGNEMAVIGIALPGIQDSLNLDKDDLTVPDYVEISADVESFEMGPTMTIAATSLFNNLDSEDLNIDELREQAEKLTDGINQLMDGSNQLADGLNTLLDQVGILVSGVDQLASGATRLQAGANDLAAGASQLQGGAAALSNGLSTLDSNSEALNSGARQVFNSLLSSANTQIAAAGLEISSLTIDNYASVLNSAIASLDETAVYESALQQVTSGVNARRPEIETAVTAAVQQQVESQVLAQVTATVRENVTAKVAENEAAFRAGVIQKALGMTVEQYQQAVEAGLVTDEQQAAVDEAVTAAMAAETEKQMESETVQEKIAAISQQTTTEKMASDEIHALIAQNTELQVEKAISDTMASPEVQGKLQAAAEGAKSLIALKSSLDSYNGFYLGVLAYTSGVSSATAGSKDLIAGADKLKGGMDTLSGGVNDLNSGIQTMKGKTPALVSGITALRDGSTALNDGLTKLMEEGIQKIADLAENDLEDLTARLCASIDAAHDYRTFSGIAPDTEGTVKFIFKTDSISVAE